MNHEENRSLPPELRAEVERKPPAARQQIEQVWRLLGSAVPDAAAPGTAPDAAPGDTAPGDTAAWIDLQRRLAEAEASGDAVPPARRPAPDRAPAAPRSRLRLVLGVATAVAAVFVVGLWLWQQPVSVVAPAGEQLTVRLPDGSTVELNSATRLRHARSFESWPFVPAAERVVELEGEAFFDVAHTGRPFVVETSNARVEVLGTQFNVRSRRAGDGAETRVTLATGRVRVTAPGRPGDGVVLDVPGAVAHVADTTHRPVVSVPALPLDDVLAWRRQGFSVFYQPLAAVLDEMERRYAIRIEAESGLALTESMFLVYRDRPAPEDILHDICLAQDCRFRRTSQGFVLYRPAPASE